MVEKWKFGGRDEKMEKKRTFLAILVTLCHSVRYRLCTFLMVFLASITQWFNAIKGPL